MPVNGIGSPSTARVATQTAKKPAAQPVPPPPANDTGWAAGSTALKRPLDLSLPKHISSAADVAASTPNPLRAQIEAALSTYTSKVETTLGHDAMSMARGRMPVREGDLLSDAQQAELKNAATDLIKSLPIGALNPDLAADVQTKLQSAGIKTRDVPSLKLGDFKNLGRDIAKDLVKDLKSNSPTAFYSLAGGLAVAAGVVAWQDGSAKLASLGIKPQAKATLFDDKLKLKLGGEWDAHFKNFKGTAVVTGHMDLGEAGRVTGSVTGNTATGFDHARLQYDFNRPNLNLSAYATANRQGAESAGGSVSWRPNDALSLSAGVHRDFQADRTTATADVTWKIRQDVDFALSASHDSQGDSRIGTGVRIRF